MANTKLPSGMRDYLSEVAAERCYVMGIIENTYCSYGFLPLETPMMENLSTLLGEYGEEDD